MQEQLTSFVIRLHCPELGRGFDRVVEIRTLAATLEGRVLHLEEHGPQESRGSPIKNILCEVKKPVSFRDPHLRIGQKYLCAK